MRRFLFWFALAIILGLGTYAFFSRQPRSIHIQGEEGGSHATTERFPGRVLSAANEAPRAFGGFIPTSTKEFFSNPQTAIADGIAGTTEKITTYLKEEAGQAIIKVFDLPASQSDENPKSDFDVCFAPPRGAAVSYRLSSPAENATVTVAWGDGMTARENLEANRALTLSHVYVRPGIYTPAFRIESPDTTTIEERRVCID